MDIKAQLHRDGEVFELQFKNTGLSEYDIESITQHGDEVSIVIIGQDENGNKIKYNPMTLSVEDFKTVVVGYQKEHEFANAPTADTGNALKKIQDEIDLFKTEITKNMNDTQLHVDSLLDKQSNTAKVEVDGVTYDIPSKVYQAIMAMSERIIELEQLLSGKRNAI